MTIHYAESFDIYGTSPNGGRDAMLAGVWSALTIGAQSTLEVSTDFARTGNASLKISHTSFSTGGAHGRRAFTGDGCAFGYYIDNLPNISGVYGVQLRDADNNVLIKMSVQSDGSLGVYYGSAGTVLIATTGPVITAQAWHHIEFRFLIDSIAGEFEIRVNGEEVLNLDELDLGSTAATQINFGTFYNFAINSTRNSYYDDIVAWDGSTFMGPVRVETLFPDSDVSPIDWTVHGAAAAYQTVDEVPPDGDTSYIEAEDVNDVAIFGIPQLTDEVDEIRGVQIVHYSKLSAVGTGNVQASIMSGADEEAGPDTVITSAYTYWNGGVFEVDPDTGVAWTRSGLAAANIKVERTA